MKNKPRNSGFCVHICGRFQHSLAAPASVGGWLLVVVALTWLAATLLAG